jgi:hypothetical protein
MSRTVSRSQHGQEIVEFAVTLTFFMLIVIMIFDFGRAIYTYSVVQNAAREGARYGIIHPDDPTGMEARVRDKAIGLDPDEINVITEEIDDDDIDEVRDAIRVTVEYDFTPLTPLAALFFPDREPPAGPDDHLTMIGRATMRIEE